MDFKECILSRRAVRKYTDEAVSRDEIKAIVELAAYTPSWKNTQSVSYCAITDSAVKEKLADECMMDFHGNIHIVKTAPAAVVLLSQDRLSGCNPDGSYYSSKGSHWESFDAGAAAQTFCLAANGLGYATVIMGIFDEAKVKALLNLPDNVSVSAIIGLGHAEMIPNAPKRKTADELLKFI